MTTNAETISSAIDEKLDIVWIDPHELIPYEKNPRHNENAVEPVACSIEEFGWRQPIVAAPDKVIIMGHTRWKAAIQRRWARVPVHFARDLSPEKIKALRLADNRTGELATWDLNLLQLELDDLNALNFKMDEFGFSETELNQILQEKDPVRQGKTDPDAVPESGTETFSRQGTVYQLGRHRLLCGDSTDPAALENLLAGRKTDLWLTDPPYNVNYVGKTADMTIANDNLAAEDFERFLRRAFTPAAQSLRSGGSFYVFHSDNWGLAFRQAVAAAGLQLRQNLIWIKNGFVIGRQDYQWAHEACLYGWKNGAPHGWYADRRQRTVIDIEDQPFVLREDGRYQLKIGAGIFSISADAVCEEEPATVILHSKPKHNDLHPTMKPVSILVYLIRNSSRRGESILDNFGGSGSTLIAAEQTERTAYLLELSERYCDVIRKRWAEFVHGEGCNWQALTPEAANA